MRGQEEGSVAITAGGTAIFHSSLSPVKCSSLIEGGTVFQIQAKWNRSSAGTRTCTHIHTHTLTHTC